MLLYCCPNVFFHRAVLLWLFTRIRSIKLLMLLHSFLNISYFSSFFFYSFLVVDFLSSSSAIRSGRSFFLSCDFFTVFINILFQFFFEMTNGEVILEKFIVWELFLAEIAFIVRAFLVDCPSLWNMERRIQKLFNLVMSHSNMTHYFPTIFAFKCTNCTAFPFNERPQEDWSLVPAGTDQDSDLADGS